MFWLAFLVTAAEAEQRCRREEHLDMCEGGGSELPSHASVSTSTDFYSLPVDMSISAVEKQE